MIDKQTLEIKQDPASETSYTTLSEIGDDLPDHAPRYVLLSYPLTLVCPPFPEGRYMIEDGYVLMIDVAVRTHIGAVCAVILPTRHLQRGIENVVCGCEGVDEKYG